MNLWLDCYSSKLGGDPDAKFKREGWKQDTQGWNVVLWNGKVIQGFFLIV